MSHTIRYGAEASFEIDAGNQPVWFASPGTPLDDPAAAVAAALADPLDFPPILQATVPGDEIVIALVSLLTQAPSILAGVVHTLLGGNVQPSDITVLQSASETSPLRDPRELLPEDVRARVQLETHDPANPDSMAYLATTRDGKIVYLNRTLCNADVVIPIGFGRLISDSTYVPDGLFPTFSNDETRQNPKIKDLTDSMEQAEEVAWLLGVQFGIHLIPGPGDSILHVLAGDLATITRRGARLCESAWQFEVSERADLVVAAIEGGPEHQTWENFSRALDTALRAVCDDGAIVICTELQCQPKRSVPQLSDENFQSTAVEDTWSHGLSAVDESNERVRVYLLSDLAEEQTEPLGLGYVASPNEINRLMQQYNSCILLPNAHHAVLKVQD